MKKLTVVLLAAIMLFSMMSFPAFAEAEAPASNGPKNYLTAKWESKFFAGNLEETEEDGVTVTTYTPANPQSWMSPTLDIYNDLKTLMGEKKGISVIFTYEVRGIFKGDGEGQVHNIIRAINPKTKSFEFKPDQTGNWDGKGSTWEDLYGEVVDGELSFAIDGGGNNMVVLEPAFTDITADDWNLFETDPIYIAAEDLDDTLFGGMLLCVDALDYSNLTSLQFRNVGIYDYDEVKPTKAPTAEPTEVPATDEPQEPEKTAEAVKTDVPTDNSTKTEAPKDNSGTDKDSGPNIGLIIGIICAAVAIAVIIIIIAVVAKKKKKG